MTPEHFWESTLALVTELYRVQILTFARNRDFFIAELCALTLNKLRREDSDKLWTADDLLSMKYPEQRKESVIITPHDPDRGAQCSWTSLRDSLKLRSDAAKLKREQTKLRRRT